MTLLELIVVVAVLIILASAFIPFLVATLRGQRLEVTLTKMDRIDAATKAFFQDTGRMPRPGGSCGVRDLAGECTGVSPTTVQGYRGPYLTSRAESSATGYRDLYYRDGWNTDFLYVGGPNSTADLATGLTSYRFDPWRSYSWLVSFGENRRQEAKVDSITEYQPGDGVIVGVPFGKDDLVRRLECQMVNAERRVDDTYNEMMVINNAIRLYLGKEPGAITVPAKKLYTPFSFHPDRLEDKAVGTNPNPLLGTPSGFYPILRRLEDWGYLRGRDPRPLDPMNPTWKPRDHFFPTNTYTTFDRLAGTFPTPKYWMDGFGYRYIVTDVNGVRVEGRRDNENTYDGIPLILSGGEPAIDLTLYGEPVDGSFIVRVFVRSEIVRWSEMADIRPTTVPLRPLPAGFLYPTRFWWARQVVFGGTPVPRY